MTCSSRSNLRSGSNGADQLSVAAVQTASNSIGPWYCTGNSLMLGGTQVPRELLDARVFALGYRAQSVV